MAAKRPAEVAPQEKFSQRWSSLFTPTDVERQLPTHIATRKSSSKYMIAQGALFWGGADEPLTALMSRRAKPFAVI